MPKTQHRRFADIETMAIECARNEVPPMARIEEQNRALDRMRRELVARWADDVEGRLLALEAREAEPRGAPVSDDPFGRPKPGPTEARIQLRIEPFQNGPFADDPVFSPEHSKLALDAVGYLRVAGSCVQYRAPESAGYESNSYGPEVKVICDGSYRIVSADSRYWFEAFFDVSDVEGRGPTVREVRWVKLP